MAASMPRAEYSPDPCPTCGKDVTKITAEQHEELRSLFDEDSVPPPAVLTLVPCGHGVDNYTVDTISGRVTWNTAR